MAINFPNSPSTNDIYVDSATGQVYKWTGEVWNSATLSQPNDVRELGDISSSFDGAETTFALTIAGKSVQPLNAQQLIINLGGVIQNAGTDYTVSSTNITFTTAPASGLSFTGLFVGQSVSVNNVSDYGVDPEDLSTGGPGWDTSGNTSISGILTVSNAGSATTALYVDGGARITGILTVGSSSIRIDGDNSVINVGSGVTIDSMGITAGFVTATSFYGDGSNLDNVGLGTTASVNTTGIITAVSFSGSGIGLTNVGPLGRISPISYDPGIGATAVDAGTQTSMTVTFNKRIGTKSGIATLRTLSPSSPIFTLTTAAETGNYLVTGTDRSTTHSGDQDPTVTIKVGDTIAFNNSATYGDHPMYIRVSDEGDSVSTPAAVGEGTATVTWTPTETGTYYYQCSNHAAMLGEIVVQGGGDGVIVEEFDLHNVGVPTSSTMTVSGGAITLTFASNLGVAQTYYAVFPDGAFRDKLDTSSSVGITSFYWNTADNEYETGALYTWGYNYVGNLGINDDDARQSSPTQVPGTQWTSRMTTGYGGVSGCIKSDNTLWAWGSGVHGALGQNVEGATASLSSPTQIPGTQWVNVSSNTYNMYCIKDDNTLWVWGNNASGNYELNHKVRRSSPTQVPGTAWTTDSDKFSGGTYNNAVVACMKTDGTLWMWGDGTYGQLAQNPPVSRSSPIQVPGTQWTHIKSGLNTLALKSDGTLWAWGYDHNGALAQNTQAVHVSSPVQIPGTEWTFIDNGEYTGGALKSDGTAWVWGKNTASVSELGLNDVVPRSSPTQLPGTQWSMLSMAYYNGYGIKTDGTMWGWGQGTYGANGVLDRVAYSSPRQISGTQWTHVNHEGGNVYYQMALKRA